MGEHEHEWDSEYICTVCDKNAIWAYETERKRVTTLAAENAALREAVMEAMIPREEQEGRSGGTL